VDSVFNFFVSVMCEISATLLHIQWLSG